MKQQMCEKCMTYGAEHLGALCPKCFERLVAETSLGKGDTISVPQSTKRFRSDRVFNAGDEEEWQKVVELRAKNVDEIENEKTSKPGPQTSLRDRFYWARIYAQQGPRGRSLRFAVSLDNPRVSDIEFTLEFEANDVRFRMPRETCYSRFSWARPHVTSDGLKVIFHPGRNGRTDPLEHLPGSTVSRKDIIEKLQLDRMVDEKYEAFGEV